MFTKVATSHNWYCKSLLRWGSYAKLNQNCLDYIIPLLKKTNLDTEDFKNFRPVTNLPFVSKLIEKSVAVQLVQYIDDNNFDEKLQSAYKKLHSTETALLRVHDDILLTVDVAVLLFYYCSIFLRHLTRSTMVYYFTD